ncbi:MAG TPA: polysaccharide biosynthesis tyrosine autokinase [Verrucomicrobiota bacterium]|nr:polysaccharide biosynthesis tyrosine autokinase [Verrucomicrobiota bacterium]
MDKKPFSKTAQSAEPAQHFLDYWRVIRARKLMIVGIFSLVLATTVGLTFLLPEKFESLVRIRVSKDTDVAGLYEGARNTGYDPYFVLTEFEVIKSKSVLYGVITNLNLISRWSARENIPNLSLQRAYYKLLNDMDVRQFRNTELIEVSVRSKDAMEAAEIANTIASAYREDRLKKYKEISEQTAKTFTQTLEEYDERVKALQGKVDTLRMELQISDYIAEGQGAMAPTLEPEAVRKLDMERLSLEGQCSQLEKFLAELETLDDKEKLESLLGANPNDMEMNTLISKRNAAEQERATIDISYTEEHPDVQRLNNALKTVNQQIEERVKSTISGLKFRAATLRAQAEANQQMLDDAKRLDAENSAKYRPYWNAKRDLENETRLRNLLQIRLGTENIEREIPRASIVQVTDPAEPGLKPVEPNMKLHILLGIIVGLVGGVGFAFFVEYLDTSFKAIDEVEQTLGASVIGIIPQNVGYLKDDPTAAYAEAYRVLRTNILFARKSETMNTITVVSGGAAEGKSITILNLATVFAQNDNRVLLVDSDLRRPSLHRILGVSNAEGLTSYLLKQKTLEEVILVSPIKGMDFLPSGKLASTSMGIINSTRMKEFYEEVRQRYDYVFFDSPPIMGVSDASVLASLVDMVVLVVQHRKYPQTMTLRAKQTVEKVGGNLLGIVLNNISINQDSYYYYYSGYYYDYYSKSYDSEGGYGGEYSYEGRRRRRRRDKKAKGDGAKKEESAAVKAEGEATPEAQTEAQSDGALTATATATDEPEENGDGIKKY